VELTSFFLRFCLLFGPAETEEGGARGLLVLEYVNIWNLQLLFVDNKIAAIPVRVAAIFRAM